MSMPGRALHTLFGYTDRPTVLQLLAYVMIVMTTVVLIRLTMRRPAGTSLPAE